jgi:hypothetical protein
MTYPKSLPRIRGNKGKFQPGIKAKGVLNHHPMNLSGFLFHLHTGLRGKQKYLIDLAMCTVMNVPPKFFRTMKSNLSFQTRSSKFRSEFRGESLNIAILEHCKSPTIN